MRKVVCSICGNDLPEKNRVFEMLRKAKCFPEFFCEKCWKDKMGELINENMRTTRKHDNYLQQSKLPGM
jgi:hypothetical protein